MSGHNVSFWGNSLRDACRLLTAAVAICFFVAGCALQAPPPVSDKVASLYASPPSIPERPLAIMFGDSYFNGWTGTPKGAAIASTTAAHLGYDVWVRGTGATGYASRRPEKLGTPAGSYVEQIQLEPLETRRPAAFVLLEGGLADLTVPADQFAAAFRVVVQEVRKKQPEAAIFVLGPANVYPWKRSNIVENIELQAKLCSELGLQFISVHDLMPHDEFLSYLSEDKTHPNQVGADILSERLAAELIRRGVKPNT